MNHTKEPWHATQNPEWGNANYRISNKETDEWANFGQIAYASKFNAKRIVACVNACADVDDDRLSLGYVKGLEVENTQLKAQLSWRPVSDPPKEDGFYLIVSLDLRLGVCTGTSWYRGKEFINIGPHEEVTHWLPIPPAPEAK